MADPEVVPRGSGVERKPLPGLLRAFWVGSIVSAALGVVVGYIEYRMGFARPHYNPLSGQRFMDLTEFLPVYRLLHTAAFYDGVGGSRVAYPPLSMALYAAIYATGHAARFYMASAAVWLAAALWGIRRWLVGQGINSLEATLFPLTVLLMSFPIAGLIQQGNIELYLWMLTAMGAWAFWRGKNDRAAVLWGLAAAMKLFPIVLLALLLPRRRWRAFAEGIATFAGATALSLKWLGPSMGVALDGAIHNVFGYQGKRAAEWTLHELVANHSFYNVVKFVMLFTGLPVERLTMPYYALGAVVLAGAFFGRLWRMPAANQLLALTAFMVMLPPVSYVYTLVHLYAPWVVLMAVAVRAEQAGVRVEGLRLTVLLLLPLFASFMLFTFPRVFLYGGLVQAAVLMALFGCAVSYRFEVGCEKQAA